MGVGNLAMLFGLGAAAIPVVIHLLHRRRYDVVDWGAMQFLQISETTRRRLALEDILLLLLRMGLVALLVLALAAPYGTGYLFARLGDRPNRDIVLIIDGSYSMEFDDGSGKTPWAAAKAWALALVDELVPGDSVVLLLARKQVVPVIGEPTHDLDLVREQIGRLPPPRAGSNLPRALEEAQRILSASKRPQRDIILIGDGRREGWADSETMFQWERLGPSFHAPAGSADDTGTTLPRIWMVDVSTDRDNTASYPNYALAPLRPARTVAWSGQQLTFKTALIVAGLEQYKPPHRIRLEVDGQTIRDIPVPTGVHLTQGQVPLSFTHRFTKAGPHRVALVLEPGLPRELRPPDYRLRDCLPGDNRQELTVDVVDALPVLLVNETGQRTAESSTYFLEKALALSPDPKRPPVVAARVVSSQEFEPALLQNRGAEKAPRVLVLADVPRFTDAQQQGITRFLEKGGGLLVALGPHVDRDAYNEDLFQEGRGWLPARLQRLAGEPGKLEQAATPDVRRFQHPALEAFRTDSGTLGQARFPRWWQVAVPPDGKATVAAFLSSNDPLLVERDYQKGRVLLATIPLDRSWGSNLPSLWEYPVLVHELVYNLAGVSAPRAAPLDLRESDLTPATEEDRRKVADLVPVQYMAGTQAPFDIVLASAPRQELWWLLLMGVILLLCAEVWLTRRMAKV